MVETMTEEFLAFRELEEEHNSEGAYGASLCVFACSTFLVMFYLYQLRQGKCNFHPIYVQSVTMVVYGLSTFGNTDYMFTNFENSKGEVIQLALGRYLFWIMTCPVIISNINVLLNLLTPEDLDFGRATFMMVKDLMLMCFGILGAFQTEAALKFLFITMSFLVSFWLLYDLFSTAMAKKRYFTAHDANLWIWIKICLTLFVSTWGIFPVFYIIGPPVLNSVSPGTDQILHAFGDLFAKNFFGFIAWYTRFIIIAPHSAKVKGSRAVSPFAIHGFMSRSARAKRKKGEPKAPKVLVVENRIEHQKLFTFMCAEAGLELIHTFNVHEAIKIIRREQIGSIDAVLMNVTDAFEEDMVKKAVAFKAFCHSRPHYIPVLGYTFFEEQMTKVLEIEERDRHVTDGIVHHVLDEWHLAELVAHWKAPRKHWKEIDISADLERKMYDHVQGVHGSPADTMTLLDDSVFLGNDVAAPSDRDEDLAPAMSPTSPRSPWDQRQQSLKLAARRRSTILQFSVEDLNTPAETEPEQQGYQAPGVPPPQPQQQQQQQQHKEQQIVDKQQQQQLKPQEGGRVQQKQPQLQQPRHHPYQQQQQQQKQHAEDDGMPAFTVQPSSFLNTSDMDMI